jgi:hypothetical protein
MDEIPEKLTSGDPLTIEELLEYLPALKEVPAVLLKQYALGAAVRREFRSAKRASSAQRRSTSSPGR